MTISHVDLHQDTLTRSGKLEDKFFVGMSLLLTSGAWFGSMIPPLPTRIVFVAAAICPIRSGVAEQTSP
jgi:hypothetical protein